MDELMEKLLVILVAILVLSCTGISLPVVRVESQSAQQMEGKSSLAIGMGTGFFVSKGGIIVTAAHVVQGQHKIYVYHEGRKVSRRASLLLSDDEADIAVLYVGGVKVEHPLSFCTDIAPGDDVSAWAWRGAGTEHTRGHVLGSIMGGFWAINTMAGPGFSGGPAYNDTRRCVAGVVVRSNMLAKGPMVVMVRPEASTGAMRLLRKVAPESVAGL